MRSCCRRPERAWRGLPAALALLVLAAPALPGCVTRGTHREVVAERDAAQAEAARLAERLRLLEASNESLSAERVELIDAVEDLRQAREALETELEALGAERAALEESLARREEELAAQRSEVSALRGTYDALVEDLETEVASGRIQIEQLREGIRVDLAQEILFPLGSAELGAEGRDVLRRVARRLAEVPNPVEVRGHTDDLPIQGALAARYPSNWELGGARAARVVRLLAEAGVAPGRLQAVSFADTRPVASNATPEGRARNRRIEIRLLPLREDAREADADDAAPSAGVEAP